MTNDEILESKKTWRDREAQAIKKMRRALYQGPLVNTPEQYQCAKDFTICFIGAVVIFAFSLIAGCGNAHGGEIPEDKAVNCILGEARGEGTYGIRLMASALRNRVTTQGVYGCRADISKEMAYIKAKGIYQQAVKAWRDSAKNDLVKGASFWGSKHVDGAWIAKMKKNGYVMTISHNGHEFYRKES